uniref:Palmitoyltransferase n=1 Tax=Schistocephalus solidus TaxID=70667 RepID=A0A183SU30_SCHSO
LLNEADATALDFHQCTPLHFAASSGNANLCSLLLRFYPPAFSLQDERGNTPLHLSCCKGKSATALAMLHGIFASSIGFRVGTGCQNLEFFMHPHAIFLDVRNNEGNRAEDMATRSGHYELAEIMALQTNVFPCLFLHFLVPVCIQSDDADSLASAAKIFLESRELAAAPFPSAEDRDGKPQLCPLALGAFKRRARSLRQKAQRLCHTCGCVKPLRAKHCGQCNRCVDVMDHHCPVTNNCVGKNNRVWFLLTGIFVLISSSVTGYLAFMAWYWSPKTWFCDIFTWILLFSGWTSALNASVGTVSPVVVGCFICIYDNRCFFYFLVLLLHPPSLLKLSRALFNVTTNELVNWPRYAHFRGERTGFHNPFDKGFRRNLVEFFRPGPTVLEDMPTADKGTNQETSYPFVV